MRTRRFRPFFEYTALLAALHSDVQLPFADASVRVGRNASLPSRSEFISQKLPHALNHTPQCSTAIIAIRD